MSRRKDQTGSSTETGPRGLFQRVSEARFCGAVWDPAEPERRFVVELVVDGISVDLSIADKFDAALKQAGDGCHGFSFEINADILVEAHVAEARLANLGTLVGSPVFLQETEKAADPLLGVPPVRWLGGLRFSGAVASEFDETNAPMPAIRAIIDGEVVAEALPDHWQNNGLLDDEAKALAAFDLYLPQHFADGCVHRVRFVNAAGQQLPGSPLVFVTFADGLAALAESQGLIESDRLRARMFDRLVPMSRPLSAYETWRRFLPAKTASKAGSSTTPIGVVLVGDGDLEGSLSSLEAQTNETWVALTLPYCDNAQSFNCDALHAFLAEDAALCNLIIFAKAGFIFSPDAIARFDEAFFAHPKAFLAYGDIAIRDSQNRIWPIAFPAFDYERMLEQGYCCALFAVRRALLLGARGKTLSLYRLFNSLASDPIQAGALHLPESLGSIENLNTLAAGRALLSATAAHLRARGLQAKVSLAQSHLFPAVRIARQPGTPTVSIIIPTRNRVELLRNCIESIAPAVKKNAAEIIIVDNDSSDPETLAFLADFTAPRRRVLRVPGPFNFSKLNNLAAQAAESDYLCLLNNDVQALDSLWLNELLGRCAEPDVAAAGALLIWPSGVVQHGGVVLGPNFGATHAFNDRLDSDPGYADLLLVARECSAVTAACLVTRRSDYLAAGGLDEVFFPINFNDVDYCLKLRARGKRIIFTPHARLLHLESASRGGHQSGHRNGLFERELRSLRARWMDALLADPFYSPILSLDPVPYSALAWPLRNMTPRWRLLPEQVDIPSGM